MARWWFLATARLCCVVTNGGSWLLFSFSVSVLGRLTLNITCQSCTYMIQLIQLTLLSYVSSALWWHVLH